MKPNKAVIVIHGGAGTINREVIDVEQKHAFHVALHAVLFAGQTVLKKGGSAVEAVTQAVSLLEDCPLFNAGKGAVFTHDETHELDAAIMAGHDLQAGAVTGVHRIRNPIQAARAVMENSPHVLLAGKGAEMFAEQQGLSLVDPAYFSTEARREQLFRIQHLHGQTMVLDHDGVELLKHSAQHTPINEDKKFGTVGAVALDSDGNLAAATSTGGMSNKPVGRVGDSPLIGAGTYADNHSAAISCTGNGEMFIRQVAAYDVCALIKYANLSLADAAHNVVMKKLPKINGEGGLIAVDAQGNISLPFNSEGMYRGYAYVNDNIITAIFKNDEKRWGG